MSAIRLEQEDLERMAPTKFDNAIARFFPQWGAQRIRQRRQYAYEAAVNTRLRSSSQRLTGPEDYQAFPDRIALIKQMRDLRQNFGLFNGMIRKLSMYAFGRLRYQARTGDKVIDDQYEQYLSACFANCDLSGRHNLRKMIDIAFQSMLCDGDYGLKWQRDRAGELKLTGIEADRIGGIYMQKTAEDYFQGVTIDEVTGQPLTYQTFYRTKAGTYIDPVDVPAQDLIHVFNPERYNEYRGVTPFASVINEARDLKELMEALRIGTKFENYHSAIQYTASGLPLDDPASFFTSQNGVNNETNSSGSPLAEQDIRFGKIQVAPIGSKVEFLKSDRPSGTLQSYMESLIRLIGAPLNMPFGFLYNLSGMAGPAVRMDSGQAQRAIWLLQENMEERALNRIKNTYLMDGFARGIIKYIPGWQGGKWQYPAWPTIDGGRDSAAGIAEWRAGLGSKDIWWNEQGEDAEEQEGIILEETKRTLDSAQELVDTYEIPMELALTMLETRTQNGFYMAKAAVGEPKADAADIQTKPVGGGGGGANMSELTIKHEFGQLAPQPISITTNGTDLPLVEKVTLPSKKNSLERIHSRLAAFQKQEGVSNKIKERLSGPDRLAWLLKDGDK